MNNIQQQNLPINQSQEHLHSQNYHQTQLNYSQTSNNITTTANNNNNNNELIDSNRQTFGNTDTSLINHLVNNNNRNDLTNQLVNQSSGNFYLIQSQDYNQMAIKNQQTQQQQQQQQSIQKQFQFVSTNEMNQLQQSNLKFISTNNLTPNLVANLTNHQQTQANQSASRVILQQTNQPNQTTTFIVQPNQIQPLATTTTNNTSTTNSNQNISQMYLNINNRIVPIQTVNIKPNTPTNTSISLPAATLAQNTSINHSDNGLNGLNQMPRFQLIAANNLINNSNNNNNKTLTSQSIQQQSPQLKQVTITTTNQQQIQTYTNDLTSNLNSNKNDVNISSTINSNTNLTTPPTPTTSTATNQPQFLILSNNTNLPQLTTANTSSPTTLNNMNNSNTSITNSSTLSVEISEKMRELELIQNQLKTFQVKFQTNDKQQTTLTQQQIKAVLTPIEQAQLQKLLVQRKTVQTEIQRLQQKLLLTPASSEKINDVSQVNITTPNATLSNYNSSTNTTLIATTTSGTPLSKTQLYQQLLIKLNNFKNSKTFISATTNQKELRLTPEEFENYKKLTNLQAQFEKELALSKEQIQLIHQKMFQNDNSNQQQNQQQQTFQIQQPQQQQQQQPTTIKLSECSLSDKYKILDLIDKQINTVKTTLTNTAINQSDLQAVQQQEQLKQKYTLLIKKQSEIQTLIKLQEKEDLDKQNDMNNMTQFQVINQQQISQITNSSNLNLSINSNSNNSSSSSSSNSSSSIPLSTIQFVNNDSNLHTVNQPKQAPVKIRNVITTTSAITSTTPQLPLTKTTLASPITIRSSNNPNQTNQTNQTPLKSIVLNSTTQQNSPQNIHANNDSSNALPFASIVNLQKTYYPNLKFKSLNFDELAQNGIITKQTDDTTLDLLKELDEKASQLVNPDQIQAFTKNQVKLARKYLEQNLAQRLNKRRKFQERLDHDHKQVLEQLNMKSNFEDINDAIKHLTPYHIFQKTLYEPTEEESSKFDECFEQVSEKLLKTADAMKKRFHLFQLRSMQKQIVSSEETLMLKLFVDDLKQNLEFEKKKSKDSMVEEISTPTATTSTSISTPTSVKTSNIQNQSLITTEPQSTIRQILKCNNLLNDNTSSNNINNDFNLITNQSNSLKRHLKLEETEINTPTKLSNSTSTSFMPSSSSSSNNLDEKIIFTNEKIDSVKQVNGISSTTTITTSNDFINYTNNDEFNFNTTKDDSNENKDSINISGLDDLILNEDEMICQNILDY